MDKKLIEVLIVLTAAINGFGAGILWVAQGKFISECACDENKGFFNGYFWCFFMASNITGNVIAALILRSGANQSTLFIVFSVLSVLGSIVFLLLKQPKKPEYEYLIGQIEISEVSDPIKDVKDTFALLISPKMLLVTPMIIWSSISLAIYGSILISLMTRTMQNNPDFLDLDFQN
jgi:MFS family permease